jgi:hypothetical protein
MFAVILSVPLSVMMGGGASIWRWMNKKFITHQKSTMVKPMDRFTSMP